MRSEELTSSLRTHANAGPTVLSIPSCSTETRLLYAQLRAHDFLPTKIWEEKNDNNATPFTSPDCQNERTGSPHALARCNRAGHHGRDHESGLCGERNAIWPNGCANLANPATLGTATRGPLSGFSP